MRGPRISRSQH